MNIFPRPTQWDAQSRDESVTYNHSQKIAVFCAGPLSNNYPMKFDTLIGGESVVVNSATQAILLHKAALFNDNATFLAISNAKQFKKMISLADSIEGFDDAKWEASVQSVVNQVLHEKFLMDLWLFDTLCLTSNYRFQELPDKATAVAGKYTEAALEHVRAILQKEPTWVRSAIPPCHVVNKHYAVADIDVSRGSMFGNEHVISAEVPREKAIAEYKISLKKKIKENEITKEHLLSLLGKRIGCTCVPNACHGEVLSDAVKWAASTTYTAS